MGYRAIALTQVEGTGDESIGRDVAGKLGFGYLNEAIVAHVAREYGVDPATVMGAERRESFFARIGEMAAPGAAQVTAPEPSPSAFEGADTLLSLIRDAVRDAADRGSVVLVAHAACYACADLPDVLRVSVTAPLSARAIRLAAARGISEVEAAKVLRESDEGRASYLKRVYGVDEESPNDYDAVFNTGRLTRDAVVALILALVQSHPISDEPGYGQAGIR